MEYKRKQLEGVAEDDNTMQGLKWDGAPLRKVRFFVIEQSIFFGVIIFCSIDVPLVTALEVAT